MKLYSFVFAFMSECCMRPHLYAIAKHGRTEREAYKKALREVAQGGREVSEYVEVTHGVGTVKEVE